MVFLPIFGSLLGASQPAIGLQPPAKSMQAWEEDSFSDVSLIKPVADFPFKLLRNNYFSEETIILLDQPITRR
jgi:hypothetical protein